jgi:hypothetical protein
MSSFQQILAWGMLHGTTLLFALIWFTIASVAGIWVTSPVRQAAISVTQNATRPQIDTISLWLQMGTPQTVVALILLAVFLAAYISMLLVWEDFAYYDNWFFTTLTLKGHNLRLAMNIDPIHGRFWPLGLQEFNLIRRFTDTATGYHVFPIAQLLILSSILLTLDDELGITERAALLLLVLLTPSFLISFSGLVFQERDVLFFLACLMVSVKRFEKTQSIAWALTAVISAQIMIYSKETAFLVLFGFAGSRLLLRYWNSRLTTFGNVRPWDRESRLDLCLASLAVLYVILYLGFVGIHGKVNYAAAARLPFTDTVLGYTKIDLLPWLLVIFLSRRIYLLLLHRATPLLFWDGLAVGGVVCFFGYVYLSMFAGYYLAPVDLIAVLYVGRFAMLSWKKTSVRGKIAGTTLAFVVLFQNVLVSAFSLYERKNVIHAKSEIVSAIEAEYRRGAGNDVRLFFPFASSFVILEFGAYLDYRGAPVEGAVDEGSSLGKIVLAEARRTRAKNSPRGPFEDGPCVEWVRIWCQVITEPAPGDLVVVLPDDKASLAKAAVYRERGKLLFSYEPRPPLPHWLFWLFDRLPVGRQSEYRYETLPDRWMDASVTIWN